MFKRIFWGCHIKDAPLLPLAQYYALVVWK